MAVGIRLKFAGGTQDQYEAMHSQVRADEDPPAGLIFHSAGPIDEGWGVIDFWESRAAFDEFLQTRVQQAVTASGMETQGPPDIKEFPVHEMFSR